jgi:hypothetical protein
MMRNLCLLSLFVVGCPSAPKVMIEGSLLEFMDETGSDTGLDANDSDDDGDSDGGDDDGGDDDGGGDDGDSDGGDDDGGGGDDGDSDGDSDGGDDDGGGDDDDGGDDGTDTIWPWAGDYEGNMSVVGGLGELCSEDMTITVDDAGGLYGEADCASDWLGVFPLKFVGEANPSGDVSGTCYVTLSWGDEETEFEGTLGTDGLQLTWGWTMGPSDLEGSFESY